MPATDRVGDARKILVYGVTGSGKSTMAEALGEVVGLPVTSVDDITWNPGWVPMPVEDQIAHFDALTRTDAWVLDSAYGHWRGLVLERADLVVALDYPRLTSLTRLLRRTVARVISGKEICNGNRETFRGALLTRDSILWWQHTSFRRKRREMRTWEAAASGPRVIRLRRPAHARHLLAEAAACQTAGEPPS